MEWKIESITEGTDIDENGTFQRYKKVRFTVNGGRHTVRVSMPDFDRGKLRDIVESEAKKLIQAYSGK